MEHYKNGVADSVAAFCFSSKRPPPGNILVSNTKYVQNIRPRVRLWPQTAAVVNRADRHLTARVISCCKLGATVGICCLQSSAVEMMTP